MIVPSHPLSRRRAAGPLALALLLLALVPLAAQEPPPGGEEPPRFLIERVTVEGARPGPARIVEAESLLREGVAYTENELRQAVARIHRLPFVLEAEFSLRKGSERGTYELLISVQQARWFFFDRDTQLTFFDEPLALESFLSETWSIRALGLAGARAYVGRSGVVFAALSGLSLQGGYTQYDLFGRGIVASIGYSASIDEALDPLPYGIDPNLAVWEWEHTERASLNLAFPLSRNDSIQVGWSERWGEPSSRHQVFGGGLGVDEVFESIHDGELRLRRGEARWVRDTGDDPLLPTRGFALSAGLEYTHVETRDLAALLIHRDAPPEEIAVPPFAGRQVAASFSAVRHWSLTPRQSVSAGGRLSIGRSDIENLPVDDDTILAEADLDVFGGSLQARHLLRLWTLRGEDGFGDFYLESGVTAGRELTSPDPGTEHNPLDRLELSTALVFRNQWGRLRLKVAYLDLGEVGR
jgi:hypothetical protein